jgi:hypothetical protein
MAYLQLDLDAKKRIPLVARAAGVSPGDVYVGLFDLWEQAFLKQKLFVTLTELRGCFGPDIVLIEALVTFGFLEAPRQDLMPGEYRIRGGSERLLKVRLAQSEAGKRAAGNLRRGKGDPGGAGENDEPAPGLPPAYPEGEPEGRPRLLHPTPNTKHQDLKKEVEEISGAPRRAKKPSPSLSKTLVPLGPRPDDRFASGEAFFLDLQHARFDLGYVTEKPPDGLAEWWTDALKYLEGDPEPLWDAFVRFWRDPYWKKRNPPFPFIAFMRRWQDYLPIRRPKPPPETVDTPPRQMGVA